MAAVKALAGGASGFVDSRPYPAWPRPTTTWPRQHTPSPLLQRRQQTIHGDVHGALSACLGGSRIRRAVLRLVTGGALGPAFTYGVGHLFSTAIG